MSTNPDLGAMLRGFQQDRTRRKLLETVAAARMGLGWSDLPLIGCGLFIVVLSWWTEGTGYHWGFALILGAVLGARLHAIDRRIDALVKLLEADRTRD